MNPVHTFTTCLPNIHLNNIILPTMPTSYVSSLQVFQLKLRMNLSPVQFMPHAPPISSSLIFFPTLDPHTKLNLNNCSNFESETWGQMDKYRLHITRHISISYRKADVYQCPEWDSKRSPYVPVLQDLSDGRVKVVTFLLNWCHGISSQPARHLTCSMFHHK